MIGTKDDVRYSGTATEQDAKALGDALKAQGYFVDRGATVVLSKGSDGTVISFAVKDGSWNDDNSVEQIEQVARSVASSVGGLPLKARMANAALETKKEVVVHPTAMFGKDSVAYDGDATEQDANALGKALQTAGYFQDRGVAVFVWKGSGGTVVSFVVQEGAWDDEEKVNGFHTMVGALAPEIGGLPIKVRLLDATMQPKKEFTVG